MQGVLLLLLLRGSIHAYLLHVYLLHVTAVAQHEFGGNHVNVTADAPQVSHCTGMQGRLHTRTFENFVGVTIPVLLMQD